jgi:hypothetical protein
VGAVLPQIALGKTPSEAGLYILSFFIGFVIAAQIGGRMLDRIGAEAPVVLGCALAAVGVRASRLSLRRGDRHHPDGSQLHRQPGAGDPRRGPGLRDALPDRHVAETDLPEGRSVDRVGS